MRLLLFVLFAATACGVAPSSSLSDGLLPTSIVETRRDAGNTWDAGVQCYGCNLGGVCKVGTSPTACGANGAVCAVCSGTESCVDGSCRLSCDDTTCPSGCCSAGRCVAPTNSFCGTSGATCAQCTANEECVGGSCAPMVVVTLSYYYNGQHCYSNPVCTTSIRMLSQRWSLLSTQYSGCTVNTTATDIQVGCPCLPTSYCCLPSPAFTDPYSCKWDPP